jgi:hypothetical protein
VSRHGDIVQEWDGDEVTFRLGVRQWRKIQERCDAGPAELITRLAPACEAIRKGLSPSSIFAMGMMGSWRLDDVREPILQGLLGGGMSLPEAEKMVKDRVDERPMIESVLLTFTIIAAGVFGVEDEKPPPGEKKAKRTKKTSSPAGSSASQTSTETAPS